MTSIRYTREELHRDLDNLLNDWNPAEWRSREPRIAELFLALMAKATGRS